MKSLRLLIFLSLILVVACTSKNQKTEENSQVAPSEYRFSVPEVPVMISKPENQRAYLAEHYWDNFDFKDSTDLELKTVIEDAFVDYLVILLEVQPTIGGESVRSLMERASDNKKLTMYFAEKAEKYLNHPNSPIRNDFLYEGFLKGILACKVVEPVNKARFQYQFDLAQKNKPGTPATDFEYTLKDGRHSTLYKTPGKLMMLYFYNPDCHECAAMKDRIVDSQIIGNLQAKGVLKILALFPDKEIDMWNRNYAEYPDAWIKAYDKETVVKDKELYDLKAIPTIYLLDSDKTVILRDPTFEQLEGYLNSL